MLPILEIYSTNTFELIIQSYSPLLAYILLINIINIIMICLCDKNAKSEIFFISLSLSIIIFLLSMYCFKYFLKHEICTFQFNWQMSLSNLFNFSINIGLDSLSLCFLILTTFMLPICIFSAEYTKKDYKLFILYLLIIELSLILTFISMDLFLFYVSFETVLIPMFLIILNWGSRHRKLLAGYYLFLYTLVGSFFLLFALFWIYLITGTTKFDVLLFMTQSFEEKAKSLLFWCLLIPFGIKLPMFPFHIWLTEAHVEAPTVGSIILASLLLKLGGYGFFRFLYFIMSNCYHYNNFLYALAIAGIIFGSLATIRQIDLKRAIAYSSIAHMNVIALAIFSLTKQGWQGALYMMIGHAFVSSAMFFCVGILYNRHHTRLIRYFGGLVQAMPLYSILFFIFSIANMSFPGTCNFIGEFLIFLGLSQTILAKNAFILLFFACFGIILSAIYSIYLVNRIIFGTWKTLHILRFADVTLTEFLVLFVFCILIFVFGINSELINWVEFRMPFLY